MKMRSKARRNLLIFVIVIALIIVTIKFIIPGIFSAIAAKNRVNNKNNPHPLIDTTIGKSYEDSLASQASDIEGMSKLDKRNMGLLIEDGSDSDGDGLTDKAEIEEYKSDPLKASTAGDLYTDGYKAQNGMDIGKAYEGAMPDAKFAYPAPKGVTLTPATAEDYNAIVMNVTGKYEALAVPEEGYYAWTKDHTIYREYEVTGFHGKMSFDVSSILSENEGLEAKDIQFMISDGMNFHKINKTKSDAAGNIITPDISGVKDQNSFLVVIARKSLTGKLKSDIENSSTVKALKGSIGALSSGNTGDAIALIPAYFAQFMNHIGGSRLVIKPTIYYYPSGNKTEDDTMLSKMIEGVSTIMETELVNKEDHCKELSKTQFEAKKLTYEKLLKNNKLDYGQVFGIDGWDGAKWLVMYFEYSDMRDGLAKENKIETKGTGNEGFFENEVFKFPNFGSSIAPGGNCAGISQYIATLHNKGTVPSSGAYDFTDKGITPAGIGNVQWNISADAENSTLLDKGLSDYKDADWTRSHSTDPNLPILDESSLSAGEKQFVDMIGAYWGEMNTLSSESSMIDYRWDYLTNQTVRELREIIDSGRVASIGLSCTDHSGEFLGWHVVTAYGYEQYRDWGEDGEDNLITVFKVYDCSYPENNTTNNLVMTSYWSGDDDSDIVSFSYDPTGSVEGYVASSNIYNNISATKGVFEVTDDEYNNYTHVTRPNPDSVIAGSDKPLEIR